MLVCYNYWILVILIVCMGLGCGVRKLKRLVVFVEEECLRLRRNSWGIIVFEIERRMFFCIFFDELVENVKVEVVVFRWGFGLLKGLKCCGGGFESVMFFCLSEYKLGL